MPDYPLIRLHLHDNVAVACCDAPAGARLSAGDVAVTARQLIPAGHKVALADIAAGEPVVKYGETIGVATQAIRAGEHVHLHNLASVRDSEGAKARWR